MMLPSLSWLGTPWLQPLCGLCCLCLGTVGCALVLVLAGGGLVKAHTLACSRLTAWRHCSGSLSGLLDAAGGSPGAVALSVALLYQECRKMR